MAWKITKDLISEGDEISQVDRGFWPNRAEEQGAVRFRLYDDDGNLYFEGVMNAWQYENDPFGPLDWAIGFAGATEIRLFENGTWNTL